MNLLQESCHLKNYVISHANCQDPNIDIWVKNEATKYVRSLHAADRVNSIYSVPSEEERKTKQEKGELVRLRRE